MNKSNTKEIKRDWSETPQAKYDKANMISVSARYKKDFVEEFRNACKILGVKQSDVIRQTMEDTINKSKQKNL